MATKFAIGDRVIWSDPKGGKYKGTVEAVNGQRIDVKRPLFGDTVIAIRREVKHDEPLFEVEPSSHPGLF